MKLKGINERKEFKLSRSFINSRLEKEYLAKSYELIVPIIELEIRNDDHYVKYIYEKIKIRG